MISQPIDIKIMTNYIFKSLNHYKKGGNLISAGKTMQ